MTMSSAMKSSIRCTLAPLHCYSTSLDWPSALAAIAENCRMLQIHFGREMVLHKVRLALQLVVQPDRYCHCCSLTKRPACEHKAHKLRQINSMLIGTSLLLEVSYDMKDHGLPGVQRALQRLHARAHGPAIQVPGQGQHGLHRLPVLVSAHQTAGVCLPLCQCRFLCRRLAS